MFNVLLKGFPSKEQAELFVEWFGDEGEQGLWDFANINEDTETVGVDYTETPKWNGNTFEAKVSNEV